MQFFCSELHMGHDPMF